MVVIMEINLSANAHCHKGLQQGPAVSDGHGEAAADPRV